MTMLMHATCVALRGLGGSSDRTWQAALLRGPSGAGKSDLAARLIETGARLVADDQTQLSREGDLVVGAPPATLAGLLEVRGVGIVKLAPAQLLARAPVALLVDLVPIERIERMPEAAHECLLGIDLPVLCLAPFEASASAKLRLAMAQIAAS